MLHRSLLASSALITRSLAEVRLTQGIQNPEQFAVAAFIDEIASASILEANARAVRLDRHAGRRRRGRYGPTGKILAAVVGNLLQNAFKFTRPCTTVTLSVDASPERVRHRGCGTSGGLGSAKRQRSLFRLFEQRSADRTGVGLGLAFSRWGAEANDGRISACNLRWRGMCFFTVDLPRPPVPAFWKYFTRRPCSTPLTPCELSSSVSGAGHRLPLLVYPVTIWSDRGARGITSCAGGRTP